MNIDNGDIRPWDSLTADEKESGRWVKLSEDEFAMAERIEAVDRRKQLTDIFGPPKSFEEVQHEAYARKVGRRCQSCDALQTSGYGPCPRCGTEDPTS